MMNVLFILNDPPNETGRSLNALRLACSMSIGSSSYVRIFLIGSGAACARKRIGSRSESNDAAALITAIIQHGGEVRICGTCMHPGAVAEELVQGTMVSSLDELARWIPEAERLLVF